MQVISRTHVGLVRENNEDALLVREPSLFAVADGMGGYAAGEIASRSTIKAFEAATHSLRHEQEEQNIRKVMLEAFDKANTHVFKMAVSNVQHHILAEFSADRRNTFHRFLIGLFGIEYHNVAALDYFGQVHLLSNPSQLCNLYKPFDRSRHIAVTVNKFIGHVISVLVVFYHRYLSVAVNTLCLIRDILFGDKRIDSYINKTLRSNFGGFALLF